jgi:serine/threonine protein kinase
MSIDRYDPIRILGEGSFGKVCSFSSSYIFKPIIFLIFKVYLMRDKIKRNFVCVKIIKIKNIPKKEREATKMEVDLLKRLHHPNIVGYIDSFLSKNHESLCICMEYCDGVSFFSFLFFLSFSHLFLTSLGGSSISG